MTPTPCPTRHVYHHGTIADVNKQNGQFLTARNYEPPCLNPCGNTSVNTDQTRRPSSNACEMETNTQITNLSVDNLGSYNRLIWTTLQDHEKIPHESTTLNNPKTLPKTLTQYRLLTTCSATLTAKQQVDEWRIACHLRFPAGMT